MSTLLKKLSQEKETRDPLSLFLFLNKVMRNIYSFPLEWKQYVVDNWKIKLEKHYGS